MAVIWHYVCHHSHAVLDRWLLSLLLQELSACREGIAPEHNTLSSYATVDLLYTNMLYSKSV